MNFTKHIIGIFAIILSLTSLHASKLIVVDLTHQVAVAYQDGKVKFFGRVSTGKSGRRTPTGTFRILEKELTHTSSLWPAPNGGAKMPYMMRLTRDGIAMHLGPTPNYPASHGCIRLKSGFAQRMYAWADRSMTVKVLGVPPKRSPKVKLYDTLKAEETKIANHSHFSPLEIMSGRYNTTSTRTMKTTTTKNTHKPRSRVNPLSAVSGRHVAAKKVKIRHTHKRKSRKKVNPLKAIAAR